MSRLVSPEPRLRKATRDDGPAIRTLIGRVFDGNPKTDPAIMNWQYWDNPYGEPNGWIWETDDAVVCHHTMLKLPGQIGGRPELVSLGVDAATLPEYRGRGLYSGMKPDQEEEMVRLGAKVSFSFRPSTSMVPWGSAPEPSYTADARKLVLLLDDSWAAQRLHLPRSAIRLARRFLDGRRPAGSEAREIDGLPGDVEALWTELAPSLPNCIRREHQYLNWRYLLHPHSPYRYFEARSAGTLRGLAITLTQQGGERQMTYLMELMTADLDVARALVNSAAEAAEGSVAMQMMVIAGTPPADLARKAGFRMLPQILDKPRISVLIREYEGERLEVAQQWMITLSESDTY